VSRGLCPFCKHKPLLTGSGELAFHYAGGNGIGMQCPAKLPINAEEKVKEEAE